MKWLTKNQKWIYALLGLILFILIANGLLENQLEVLDNFIYSIIHYFHNSFLTMFFKIITNFVCTPFLVLICIIYYIYAKKTNKTYYSLFMILNLLGCTILNLILKGIFSRPRPIDIMLINETGFSFPSGHMMVSFAFYGFIIYLIYHSHFNKHKKTLFISSLSILILLIGMSRIYLGVHYASDVIAGLCISVFYLFIFISMFEHFKKGKTNMKKEPLWKSFKYAFEGIYSGLMKERNFKIHFIVMLLVIICGILFKISTQEWFNCLILFGIVLSLELVNTAIETTVDICMPKIDKRAKLAKDTSAGAVLISVIVAIIIGLWIFVPKIVVFLTNIL